MFMLGLETLTVQAAPKCYDIASGVMSGIGISGALGVG